MALVAHFPLGGASAFGDTSNASCCSAATGERFGSPLELSGVHWARPEGAVEATYLTWTEDNLLRQVSYQGQ